jgi:DNA (cytosine-5)-methyltransferase 1
MQVYKYNFIDELMVDNFAGGGGASTGIELATGRIVNIAVNHDRAAIEMHEKNHPYTEHFCEDVWQIDPKKVTGGRPVAIVWGSPDCTHFSKAKGGTPVSKKVRGLAWVLCKWAGTVKPRVIIMENVEEFMTWGPVIPMRKNGRCLKKVYEKGKKKPKLVVAEKGEVLTEDQQVFIPDKNRAGQTFNRFVGQLRALGYEVAWKVMRACDYGAPTSRKRFFLIARRDGQPIVFPKPTHGIGKGLKPFRTAAECIDWSIPGKSIFGRKKPLSVNTMKRIARGLDKFVIKSPKPFIMQMNFENPPQDVDSPLSTITAVNKHYVAEPKVRPYIMSNNTNNVPHGVDEPMPTITTGIRNFVCCPSLVQYHGEQSEKEVRGQRIDKPLNTIDTRNRYGISTAFLSKYYSGENQAGADVQEPMPTVTAIDHNALVGVCLSSRYGDGNDGRGQELDKPMPTVTGTNHSHLLSANLIKYYSGEEQYQSVEAPLHTITTEPRFYLASSHICTFRKNTDGQDVRTPLSTVTTKEHHAEIRTYLTKLTGKEKDLGLWSEVRQLLNDYAGYNIADDEILILDIGGIPHYISDVSMRMLEPKELAKAQGFPDDYVLQVSDSYSKQAQIARIGNSVCPVMAEVLVRANLPELCPKKRICSMSELKTRLTA